MLIALGLLLLTIAVGNAQQAHIRHWREADEYQTAALAFGWVGVVAIVAGVVL